MELLCAPSELNFFASPGQDKGTREPFKIHHVGGPSTSATRRNEATADTRSGRGRKSLTISRLHSGVRFNTRSADLAMHGGKKMVRGKRALTMPRPHSDVGLDTHSAELATGDDSKAAGVTKNLTMLRPHSNVGFDTHSADLVGRDGNKKAGRKRGLTMPRLHSGVELDNHSVDFAAGDDNKMDEQHGALAMPRLHTDVGVDTRSVDLVACDDNKAAGGTRDLTMPRLHTEDLVSGDESYHHAAKAHEETRAITMPRLHTDVASGHREQSVNGDHLDHDFDTGDDREPSGSSSRGGLSHGEYARSSVLYVDLSKSRVRAHPSPIHTTLFRFRV